MKKLIDTPEAQAYAPEIRSEVVKLVGAQLLFEWRFWLAVVVFVLLGGIVLGAAERSDFPWIVTSGVGCLVILPGALLWTYVSFRLQRWVLSHRGAELLQAVGSSHPAKPSSNAE